MREFNDLCARRSYWNVRPPPRDSTKEFLDRCCEIGFLERKDEGSFGVRYYPTKTLVEWAELVDGFL